MDTDFSAPSWNEAVRSFLIHLKAVRAANTVKFYDIQLRTLTKWAESNKIPLDHFGKRHLDEYLVFRSEAGKSQSTLHHAALCAKVFMKWCQKNDLVARSLLADYEVRNAPKPHKYMPSDEDMHKLIEAVHAFWDVSKHPAARYIAPGKRSFHRDRNYAVILTLLDSACRIGEVLSLKLDDYRADGRQITIRESKGREPRPIPVSKDGAAAIADWLKVRARVMRNVPKDQDEGWLFLSETGSRVDEGRFLKTLKKFTDFAGISSKITLHSLRRYSLNRLAKHNLLAAQAIAGHKDTKTTLIYTKIDPDFVREMHDQVGVVRGILSGKRTIKKKRLI